MIDGRILQPPRAPRPVEVPPPRVHDPRLRAVLPPDARLLELYAGASWAEGPAWWAEQNALVFSDVIGRRTLAWRNDGSVVSIVDPSAFANGNAVDGNCAFDADERRLFLTGDADLWMLELR